MLTALKKTVSDMFDAEILSCERVGGGVAGGVIFKVEIDKPPFCLAAKTAVNAELLKTEYDTIRRIRDLADIKLPKPYCFSMDGEQSFFLMEFFDGKNCADNFLLKAPKQVRLDVAGQIADNIIKLQSVKGEKYGDLANPLFDDWHDFYRPFVKEVVQAAEGLKRDGLLNQKIFDALKTAEMHYDMVFDEPISKPTPIHGDYWAQNILIDKNYKLIGVVDPFNSMWADSEYELFALNAVYGKKLPVLEAFLEKVTVSKKFFLKNSFYLLFSEVLWVCKLRHNNIRYLMKIVKDFHKQLKAFGIGK